MESQVLSKISLKSYVSPGRPARGTLVSTVPTDGSENSIGRVLRELAFNSKLVSNVPKSPVTKYNFVCLGWPEESGRIGKNSAKLVRFQSYIRST